jgi:hypothetical protein
VSVKSFSVRVVGLVGFVIVLPEKIAMSHTVHARAVDGVL